MLSNFHCTTRQEFSITRGVHGGYTKLFRVKEGNTDRTYEVFFWHALFTTNFENVWNRDVSRNELSQDVT